MYLQLQPSEQDTRYRGWLQNEGHPEECPCIDCCCLREGWHFWNKKLDGAALADRDGVPVRGRDGWVLPPGWDGRVTDSHSHWRLPGYIRIGEEYQGYNFELVHIRPVVYRCERSSGDRWSRPGAKDVLWLFRKWGHWVAGHANEKAKQIQDVLDKARLVWSTDADIPRIEGYCVWMWVDNDASNKAQSVIAPWWRGYCRTREIP